MIRIDEENLVPLREVPKRLPCRPGGKRVHISACYRWVGRGVRGVRLESVRLGGTTYTSVEALQRFAEQLSARPQGEETNRRGQTSLERSRRAAADRLEFTLGLRAGTLSERRTPALRPVSDERPFAPTSRSSRAPRSP